jgi:hypothetical protein
MLGVRRDNMLGYVHSSFPGFLLADGFFITMQPMKTAGDMLGHDEH